MSVDEDALSRLRRSFDGSFAAPYTPPRVEESNRFLGIRIENDRYAFALVEVVAVERMRQVMAIPHADPALLGIAFLRGRFLPVYHLAALLGYASSAPPKSWLVISNREQPVAWGFDLLDGYFQAERRSEPVGGAGSRQHVCDIVRDAGVVRSLLNLPSIISTIEHRAGIAR